MNQLDSTVEPELFISPKLILSGFVFFGLTLILSSDYLASSTDRFKAVGLGVLIQIVVLVTWKFSERWLKGVQWFMIGTSVGVVLAGLVWLDSPVFMALLVIPVAVAAILGGLSAVNITAGAESVLLLIGWQMALLQLDSGSLVLLLAAIWMIVGVIWAIYHPLYEITHWSWINYRQARDLLEEVRDQKMELEQALDDLAHAYRELDLLNERVTAMRLVAEEAQAAKTVFVAKVSHEFRTPLNMIIGLTDVLMYKPEVYGDTLSPALLEDLTIVHRNCEYLSKIVNDILDLSQTEIGRLTLRQEWTNLAEAVDNALITVQPLLAKKQLGLQVSFPADLPPVYCDRTRISQVLLNLVSNAARFTDQGGITISAQPQGQHIIISVTDTGPGVSPEDTERIFEPFCQGSGNPWRDQKGSGLGLSISRQFVELHGGQMWLESPPSISPAVAKGRKGKGGPGTTFSFTLPISPLVSPSVSAARWINPDWAWHERTSKSRLPQLPYKQRVLICDNTGDLYEFLSHYANEVEFIKTDTLEQAIREAHAVPAHALVVNAAANHNSGPLVEQARLDLPDTPIIIGAFPTHTKRIVEAGAINYLTKPILRVDLEKAIHALGQPIQRVLIADDDPDLRQLLDRMLLIYDNGLEVLTASNGQEALAQLQRNKPDLMLLDIAMHGMDGWQTLEQKKQDASIRDIPTIVISAQDPASQPLASQIFSAAMGPGIPADKFLRCSLAFSAILLELEGEPQPAPG
ncbi:MAG: hybrid sensor histidine kinase/response regulator [Anaerolineae bacterium]|nr:hybrid sensor histidine kinase/response regulator [Anaerolineae bacterium]